MTTYHTFDADTIPAPSDVELQPVFVVAPHHHIQFNQFCRLTSITGERENFHRWLVAENFGTFHKFDDWRCLWQMFTDIQDERDLYATQAGALSVPF
jgi:hypothetical protein